MAVVGISGSPVKDSSIDGIVQALLLASGKETKFIKLSKLKFSPCRACAHLCATTAMCGQKDDLHPYLADIRDAEALIIGSPRHHSTMTAWTYSFFSRLWCFLHENRVLNDRPVILVSTGLVDQQQIEEKGLGAFRASTVKEHAFNVLGKLYYRNFNPPCIKCGKGDTCQHGGLWHCLGESEEALRDYDITSHEFTRFEDDPVVMSEVERYGRVLSDL